jgi:hypothetical protein
VPRTGRQTLARFCLWILTTAVLISPAPSRAEQEAAADSRPTEETLGVPIYPSAEFLTSYDAGRGQSYYVFATHASFEEMVRYYAVVLDERGDRVFDWPATHVFETGRFREDRMAFPPSVTIKDFTWNGSPGYLAPTPEARQRYATVIQIVPPPRAE